MGEGGDLGADRRASAGVWEWTASDFLPYPGFRAYPYREYSEVFFGERYRVLRGCSWATDPRVATPTFRNWDLPQRRQIFAGLRLAREEELTMALTPPRQPLAEPAIRIDSHLDGAQERSLADDALDGLTRPFKELPPKHFYDARGAELFDRICELPEYYPTRAERAILESSAAEIARLTGAVELVELGSGHGRQDPRPAGRAGRGRDARPLRARSTSPRAWSANAPSP